MNPEFLLLSFYIVLFFVYLSLSKSLGDYLNQHLDSPYSNSKVTGLLDQPLQESGCGGQCALLWTPTKSESE